MMILPMLCLATYMFLPTIKAMDDSMSDSSGDPVTILSVSTRLGKENTTPVGSLEGGNVIFMKVVGLDQTHSNNAVFIGRYPCLISDKGVNGLFLNCVTTKPDIGDTNLSRLPILVQVAGKPDSVCKFSTTYCFYTYSASYTPQLYFVTPRSVFPRQLSSWRARFTVPTNEVANLEGQFIGDHRCDRFTIQDEIPDEINQWDDIVQCVVAADIEAGDYNYQIRSANGVQSNDFAVPQLQIGSTPQKSYNARVLPFISSLNTNVVSPNGQVIKISGLGFTTDVSKVQVTLSGQTTAATVISASLKEIIAKIPELTSTSDTIYLSGSGLQYTRYNLNGLGGVDGSCSGLRTQLKTNAAQLNDRIVEDGVQTEPETQNTLGERYGQYYRGFFKAPKTGSYKFLLASDDCSTIYLQTTPKSTDKDTMTLVAQNGWSPYRNYWYNILLNPQYSLPFQISDAVTLQAGDLHYIEIYHTQTYGSGYVTASVQIESATRELNSLNDLYTLTTSYTPVKEQIQLIVYNKVGNTAMTGNYQLQFSYGVGSISGLKYSYTTRQLSASATDAQMKSAIQDCGASYIVTVIRKKVDSTGAELDDAATTLAGYKYTITFDAYRGSILYRALPVIVSSTLTGGTLKENQVTLLQEPGLPISGTFQLSVDDDQSNPIPFYFWRGADKIQELPFDVSASVIADNFERIYKVRPLVWIEGRASDGMKIRIYLRGLNEIVNFKVASNSLVSGGGAVTVTVEKTIEKSNDQLYQPIPSELLFTYSSTPQISVTVNGIQGGCGIGKCDFTLSDSKTPTVTSFTRTNSQLAVAIQPGTDLPTLTTAKLSITYAGALCTNIVLAANGANYDVTCDLEQLNGNPIIEAGDNIPTVHYEDIGYSKFTGVTPVIVDLVVTSISPAEGTPDGGTTLTIVGTGFPKDLSKTITITVSGTAVTPISMTNTEIVIETPLQSSGNNIVLTYNGKTVTSTLFSYNPAKRIEVTNLEFTNQSPVTKGNMVVTGTNFGSVAGDLKAYLEKDGIRKYECAIVSAADTSLTVYLRGGMPGEYKFVVYRSAYGRSYSQGTNGKFTYAINVNSISPAVGSEAGGTRITITGSNFSPSETIVFIGNKVNWICELDASVSTTTHLECITPPRSDSAAYDSPVNVIVTSRVTLESTCVGTCTFHYQSSATPILDAYPADAVSITTTPGSRRYLSEEQVAQPVYLRTIQHRRFLWTDESKVEGPNHLLHFGKSPRRDLLNVNDILLDKYKTYTIGASETVTGTGIVGPVKVLFRNDITKVYADATLTGSSVAYTIPELAQGDYQTYIVSSTGNADKIWITRIDLTVTSTTPNSIVSGGQVITVAGGGFDKTKTVTVLIGSVACINVNVVSAVSISCRVPRFATAGSYTVTVNQQDKQKLTITTTALVNGITIQATSTSPSISSVTTTATVGYQAAVLSTVFTGDPTTVTITLGGTNLDGTTASVFVEVTPGVKKDGVVTTKTATSLTITFTNLPVGKYSMQYVIDGKFAYWVYIGSQSLTVQGSAVTSSNPSVGYAGGQKITFTGKGFDTNIENTRISICGFACQLIPAEVTFTSASCLAPTIRTTSVLNQYAALTEAPYSIKSSEVQLTSDITDVSVRSRFFDALQTTYYTSSATTDCFVEMSFGSGRTLKLQQMRYIPRIDAPATNLKGAKFQYSVDGTTYQDLLTVGHTVHSGWNIFVPNTPVQNIKSIKFTDPLGITGSKCQLADIELKGWLTYSTSSAYTTPINCAADITVNGQALPQTTNAATYSNTVTPIVNTVVPAYGTKRGGTTVTITGTGFVQNQSTVTIDGVACSVTSSSTTQIVCTTGAKDTSTNLKNGEFIVGVNGNSAVNNQVFAYGDKWSDIQTWGGAVFPGDGDSVVVLAGETLIVDTLTPKLIQILVEGNLIFADDGPTSLDAHYIIIREGRFTIGTETKPHLNKVTITLRGNWEDVQMPSMGNKVLGCHQCTLDIHGKVRTPTWTLLSSTAAIGATTITVDDAVDWQVGEQIVITSSEVEHTEAEVRTITAVSADFKTLTLDTPLIHKHYSAVETYGTEQFPMKVEVGLLSRNILIQGEESVKNYGGHLMIHGQANKGANGRISYAEFKHGGQPIIKGRYPVHFHLNGDVDDSYVVGNSIHDAYARCLTIHGVHYLKVQKNVCYNTFGHAIFLEDGIETNNVIEDNLVASIKQNWIMLQTDITCATYWITNPQNILRRNRSGGSEWYGFWYEIKPNPDGPSATSDICPQGLNVLEFKDNVAHSNGRFGLRIFVLAPREYPCLPARDNTKPDPFLNNPSITAVFEKFTTWKNNECGILGEELGTVIFRDIQIADSKLAGFQAHKTNYTKEGSLLDNALIVGKSNGNAAIDQYYDRSRGLIVPRTNGFKAQNVRLYNFGANSALIESCSVCFSIKVWVTGGKNTQFSNIKAFNSDSAQRIFWQNHRREIFWDLDGSLSGVSGGAYITPYKQHMDGIPGCQVENNARWNNSVICSMNQVQVRDVLINNPTPGEDFLGTDMRVYRLDSTNLETNLQSSIQSDKYGLETMWKIKKSLDVPFSYATPLVTGYTYNVHFKFGASDFRSAGIFASQYFTPTDKGIVLRFNYSAQRETFDVFRNEGMKFTKTYTAVTAIPDPNTCQNGAWFNNIVTKMLYLCLSGKDKAALEYVEVQGVICRTTCSSLGDSVLDTTIRYWSDVTTWATGVVPVAGDSPIIDATYKVVLDVDTPELKDLTILGQLIFDERRPETTLKARRIWARSGKLLAGNETHPFPGKINIVLLGEFGENALLIDSKIDAGNKVFAVTRGIELYGKAPGTVWTRLTAFASTGATQITVAASSDWAVGDEIVISPSGTNPEQKEKKKITAIAGNVITLDSALEFDHFGAPSVTIVRPGIGQLDMRATVGHLTRSIKVIGGPSVHGLGGRMLIYQFDEPGLGFPRRGYAILKGVEFNNMGQYDTERAGLDFRNLNSELIQTPSLVYGCSFHDSTGKLLNVLYSQFVTVENNVFFNGQKALVSIIDSQKVKFRYNLMMYVTKRQLSESAMANWAVFGNFNYIDKTPMIVDNLEVAYNVGTGSQDTGFFMMATDCAQANQASFHDNECSSTSLACYGVTELSGQCDYIQSMHAYHSASGIQATMRTIETRGDKLILVENSIGYVLKEGNHELYNNVMRVTNSYISAVARPGCPECYTQKLNPYCVNTFGFQMASISTSAFPPMSTKPSTAYDTICTTQRIDCRVYIDNLVFDQFKLAYPNIPFCSRNAAFRQHHNALDMTGQHFLTNSPCTNCEFGALLYGLRNPNYAKIGWFGGCGSFECTGQINFLIEDQDGKFFGEVGQAIGNNTYFGPNVTYCSRKNEWNGYWCPGRKITVLNFMSTAPDYNTRLYSPVKLTDGLFFNEINSFAEWEWDGPEPMNKRESKFVAIVTANSIINMTNAGDNPTSSEYWLSKRGLAGSPEDFVIIKLQFSTPMIVQVNAQGKVVQPGITKDNKHYDLNKMTTQCGANNYFYENRTIHFVVTGEMGCKVALSLKNTLQVSTRLQITTAQFFGSQFLQYAMAQLGGDPYNYFIIGTKTNRRFLQTSQDITVDWAYVDSAVIGSVDSLQSNTKLNTFAQKVNTLNMAANGYNVIESSTKANVIEKLQFKSTEAITGVVLTPGGSTSTSSNTGGTTNQGSTNTNTNTNNGNTNTNTNTNTTPKTDTSYVPLPSPSTGTDTINSNGGTKPTTDNAETPGTGSIQQAKRHTEDSQTVTIVVSVVVSVVGISILIAGLLWFKKARLAKLAAMKNQQVDNEYYKNNQTEENILRVPE